MHRVQPGSTNRTAVANDAEIAYVDGMSEYQKPLFQSAFLLLTLNKIGIRQEPYIVC